MLRDYCGVYCCSVMLYRVASVSEMQFAQTVQAEQEWQEYSHKYTQTQLEKETKMNSKTNINDLSFDQLVPSNSTYLSKDDVGEDGVVLTIKGFRNETIKGDDGEEVKMVMHFEENYKPMIVNRTNAQLIGIATGAANAGEARGKEIIVYNDPTVGFGGKITGGIRIRKLQGAPKQAAKADPQDLTDIESDFENPPF